MLKERDAVELALSIEWSLGKDAAHARQIGNGEWVVALNGYATTHKVRTCIYVCWSREDWQSIPPDTRAAIRRRRISKWAENPVKVPNMIKG